MPFPMTHLYVARYLAQKHPRLHDPDFFLGVLAPDAYVMRAQRSPEDRSRAHLDKPGLQAWREDILRFVADPEGPCGACFGLGYAAHLLTDLSWSVHVLPGYVDGQGPMSAEQRKAYVRDMTALDLTLYREDTDLHSRFWPLLAKVESQGLPGLVSAKEVDLERERTLTWYEPRAALPEPSVRLEDWKPHLEEACGFTLDGLSARVADS